MIDVKQRLEETNHAIQVLAQQGVSVPPEAIEIQWMLQQIINLSEQLKRTDELLAAHRRFHAKAGCPGRPECCVCAEEEWHADNNQ